MKKSHLIFLLFFFFVEDVVSRRRAHLRRNGHRITGGKIVGGYNTTIQNAPYQVYLLLRKGNVNYQCGGSIISEKYILTAAHCLTGISEIKVRTGSALADSGGTEYSTTKFKQHPHYNSTNTDFDVGVIEIKNGMTLDGQNTRAVQLPSGGTIEPGTNILVTGWGDTTENGQISENLMAVQMPTVSDDECRKTYSSLTKRQFCAGVPEGGKDSCQGDSGGPAVATDSGQQIGIVSFGVGCARPGYPGVYTNVGRVRRWIKFVSRV